MALIRDDLPTLDRPRNATSGTLGLVGSSFPNSLGDTYSNRDFWKEWGGFVSVNSSLG